jgi:3-oxoacyl-[acyl-carrier-protein] synthase II
MGPVSAIGIGREPFAAALRAGRCGIAPISGFDAGPYRSRLAAEIGAFRVEDYLESEKTYLDRSTELAFAAVALALRDAGLSREAAGKGETAIALGSAYGGLETMAVFFEGFLEKGARFVKPLLFPHTYANTAISLVAIEYNLTGPHLAFASGLVSGGAALLAAFDWIRQGRTRVAVAGGHESFGETVHAGHERLGCLSPGEGGPERCAPFARDRNGWVLGEGAGALVLEDLESATERGARVHGEILGGTRTGACAPWQSDAPDDAPERALQAAIRLLDGGADGLDYVCASANGSRDMDLREVRALRSTLGPRAARVPVSSIKAATGETLGASGALQTIAVLSSVGGGFLPPTVNMTEPDPDAGLDFVRGRARPTGPHARRQAIAVSMDPGGAVTTLAIRASGGSNA